MQRAKFKAPKTNQSLWRPPHFAEFDGRHLFNYGILASPWRDTIDSSRPFIYHFYDRQQQSLYIELPCPDLTSIADSAGVEFLPPPERLSPCPPSFKKGSYLPAEERAPDDADYEAHMPPPRASASTAEMEQWFPEDFSAYVLSEPPRPTATAAEKWAWTVQSQRKTSSLMLRMAAGISRIGRMMMRSSCSSQTTVSEGAVRHSAPQAAAEDDPIEEESESESTSEETRAARETQRARQREIRSKRISDSASGDAGRRPRASRGSSSSRTAQ